MSDEGTCFACGGVIDNEDGTGYCSTCSADIGVYAQRAADSPTEPADLHGSIERLAGEVGRLLDRLERVEARLADIDARLGRSGGEAASGAAMAAGPDTLASGADAAATLEERARALGVDYARLRKLYSEDELEELLRAGD